MRNLVRVVGVFPRYLFHVMIPTPHPLFPTPQCILSLLHLARVLLEQLQHRLRTREGRWRLQHCDRRRIRSNNRRVVETGSDLRTALVGVLRLQSRRRRHGTRTPTRRWRRRGFVQPHLAVGFRRIGCGSSMTTVHTGVVLLVQGALEMHFKRRLLPRSGVAPRVPPRSELLVRQNRICNQHLILRLRVLESTYCQMPFSGCGDRTTSTPME